VDESPVLISKRVAARRLSIGLRTLEGLLRRGELRSVRIGRRRLIAAEELLKFARNRSSATSRHRGAMSGSAMVQ
jgi:excisionase family DNA binding protein